MGPQLTGLRRNYWCRWLNESGWVLGGEKVRAISDEIALATARMIAANYPAALIEVWEGKQLAAREQSVPRRSP